MQKPAQPARQTRRLQRPGPGGRPERGKKHGTSGQPGAPNRRTLDLPVEWTENAPARPGFAAEYVSIGSLPGILHRHLAKANRLRKVLCQTLVLSRSSRALEGTADARFTSSLLIKILRRGRTPLATLGVERAALEAAGLTGEVAEHGEDTPRGRLEEREADARSHRQGGHDPGGNAQEAPVHPRPVFRRHTR